MTYIFIEVIHIKHVCAYVWVTRLKILKEQYSAVFNSAVADKKRRIAEIKTPQKLPAIRYHLFPIHIIQVQVRVEHGPIKLIVITRFFLELKDKHV